MDTLHIPCHPAQQVPEDMHKHVCYCGACWAHSDHCANNFQAHACPKCGRLQWERYFTQREWNNIQREIIAEMLNIR